MNSSSGNFAETKVSQVPPYAATPLGRGLLAAAALCAVHTVAAADAVGPRGVVTLVVCILFVMFAGALWVVYKIWMTVIDVVANKSAEKSSRLAAILGKSELGVDMKGVRAKAVGVGLSTTIAILALAVAAMWVLNNQTVV